MYVLSNRINNFLSTPMQMYLADNIPPFLMPCPVMINITGNRKTSI